MFDLHASIIASGPFVVNQDLGFGKYPTMALNDFDDFLKNVDAEEREKHKKTLEAYEKYRKLAGLTPQARAIQSAADAIQAMQQGVVALTKGAYAGDQGLSAMNPALDAMSEAGSGVGRVMMLLGGQKARLAGLILKTVLPMVTNTMKRGAQQADRQFETFQKLSQTGATASDGMAGVANDAKLLGYNIQNLDKFVAVIKDNSQALTLFSGSAAQGRRDLANAGSVLYESNARFLEMGLNQDDVANYLADYINTQTQHGVVNRTTYQDLAAASKDYIMEQNTLNQLTGMSRQKSKEMQEAAAKEEIFGAVKAKLSLTKAGAEQAARLDRVSKVLEQQLDPVVSKGFRDATGPMGAITKESIQLMQSGNPHLKTMIDALMDNQISEEEFVSQLTKNIATFRDTDGLRLAQLKLLDDRFLSITAQNSAAAANQQDIVENLGRLRQQEIERSQGQVDTNLVRMSRMIDAQQKMTRSLQDFNESFNGIYYPVATLFTNAMTLFYTTLEKVTRYIPGLGPSKPKPASAPAAAPAGQPGSPAARPTAPAAAPTNRSTPAAPAAPTGGGAATPAPAAAAATQPAAGRPAPAATQAPTQPATESTAPVSLNQAPITTASQQAYSMIESFESFTPRAHWDFKQYSIGYGTRTDDPDEIAGTKTIDKSEARRRLNEHVDKVVPAVVRAGQARQWGQNQIDAITSFAYNMGAGQIRNLTAGGTRTNQETADSLPLYNKAGGQKSAGLARRRTAEQALFLRDMPMMGDGGITQGPSIAGERGPEAVIPLTQGRVTVDLGTIEDTLKSLIPVLEQTDPGNQPESTLDLDSMLREASEIYMTPNTVEQEILDLLRSISRTNNTTVYNNQRIYRNRAN